MSRPIPLRAVLAGTAAALLLGLGAPHAVAATPDRDDAPSAAARAAAHKAAEAPGTRATLSRFFAREGNVTARAAEPRIQGEAVPVYYLAPDFVAGEQGAPVARLEFLASKAVSSDGQEASLWTVEQGGTWQVVNIATGDDETHYARVGAEKLPGGTVFHEPQINAWYVTHHARVLPLDQDATHAIGADGTSLSAYRDRVERAYGDKLPGSPYAKSGKAGGYAAQHEAAAPQPEAAAGAQPQSEAAAGAQPQSEAAAGAQPQSEAAAGAQPQSEEASGPALAVAATAAGLGACAGLGLAVVRTVRTRRQAADTA
ncbi:hypothetical protein QIS99_14375 [Streptomyces sp. B-S-A8]|uniref:Uncharacterized protein n=1 Tax=Streptomyces solicavernae TaxID=3043614 RepID=A0ABT6RSG4_9ACTN|nr:hypothetical protein [Streptomyces sp. B-S-A8]MDI3387377.1 hypothetical protein [Streptomyces sp. B-S-A8]